VADRYAYVALLGPAILLARWVAGAGRRRVVAAVCGALLAAFGLLSAVQVQYWRDTPALFRHALAVNPKSVLAHVNLGVHAHRRLRFEDALAHYRAAVRLNPGVARAHYNIGVIRQQFGERGQAETHYRSAIRARPSYAAAQYALGILLQEDGRLAEAFKHFHLALEATKRWRHYIYTRLGSVCEEQHRYDDAARFYAEALRVEPGHPKAEQGLRRVRAAERGPTTEPAAAAPER
jgi:tetratricopeptide (TPR) repeat protein